MSKIEWYDTEVSWRDTLLVPSFRCPSKGTFTVLFSEYCEVLGRTTVLTKSEQIVPFFASRQDRMPNPPQTQQPEQQTARHTLATNLPLPVSTIKKRPRKAPRLYRRPKRRSETAPVVVSENVSQFDCPAAPSDAILALSILQAAWPHDALQTLPNTPPLLLETQLRALVADIPSLHIELRTALARRDIYVIRLPSSDRAYVYFPCTSEMQRELLQAILPGSTVVSTKLLHKNGINEDKVANLVREGYLTMRDEHSFWVAVPGMATFMKQRSEGRQEVILLLKGTQYREMGLDSLQGRSLRNSFLTAQWVVRDLIGQGILETVATSVGNLVRFSRVST